MNRNESAPSHQTIEASIRRESRRLVIWVVSCCGLFSLHVLQVVLLGQDWKDDLTGWGFMDTSIDGSGWLLWSVGVLFVTIAVLIAGLVDESPRLLWTVAVLSAVRFVLVAVSAVEANGAGFDSRFGVALSLFVLAVTSWVAGLVAVNAT